MHPPAAADTGCGAHQRKEKNVPTAALNWTHIFRLSFKRHFFFHPEHFYNTSHSNPSTGGRNFVFVPIRKKVQQQETGWEVRKWTQFLWTPDQHQSLHPLEKGQRSSTSGLPDTWSRDRLPFPPIHNRQTGNCICWNRPRDTTEKSWTLSSSIIMVTSSTIRYCCVLFCVLLLCDVILLTWKDMPSHMQLSWHVAKLQHYIHWPPDGTNGIHMEGHVEDVITHLS